MNYGQFWAWRLLVLALIVSNCSNGKRTQKETLFTLVQPDSSGVSFSNDLHYTEDLNPYTYRNFYNGGGVGIGDVNNDGLPDLFFCGNMVSNRLYLNKGNFRFEDITEAAGLTTTDVWSTGVAMVDLNGDGWLDIYVCKSGPPGGAQRHNQLFINQKDGTFRDEALRYGLGDVGLSSHAAFFDYDKDGDLDCYLLNNSMKSVGGFDLVKGARDVYDPNGGNKLYRNDGPRFTDVTKSAGIYGSAIGFGLGVTVGDINRDGWVDLYVSNDFFERDYLYLNQQDGTFKEALEDCVQEISLSSMGADMADINNDGWPEVFVTDMLPEEEARRKSKTQFDSWDKFRIQEEQGYYRQFTRNVLQTNLGPHPYEAGKVLFAETGRFAGVHATDWSWGALFQDWDLDGYKDLFVANGIFKDLTDQDYIQFADPQYVSRKIMEARQKGESGMVITSLIDSIPSNPIPNFAFKNLGNGRFENQADAWGLGTPGFSNGSAYADLDGDGDADLITNNVNAPASIYRNNARQLHPEKHFLSIQLQGIGSNTKAIGAQVVVHHKGRQYYQEVSPMRGFQSCVDATLLFGLDTLKMVDTLWVYWPNGQYQWMVNVKTNQTLKLQQEKQLPFWSGPLTKNATQFLFSNQEHFGKHQENSFVDFDQELLLDQSLSAEGPGLTTGDVNGDGLEDVFVTGAYGQAGQLWLQTEEGTLRWSQQSVFLMDSLYEDTDALLVDVDKDKDLDLVVVAGGGEGVYDPLLYRDRIYWNDGKGVFSAATGLPTILKPKSCIRAYDFDKDGDEDLFVGNRFEPGLYGISSGGQLYLNDGHGKFTDQTKKWMPSLADAGMICDAAWTDYNKDGFMDLITISEWGQVTFWENDHGQKMIKNHEENPSLTGLWNCLKVSDLNNDGWPEIILGNEGENTQYPVSPEFPGHLYLKDFDENGKVEQVRTWVKNGLEYPVALRHDLVRQLPGLKKKYLHYHQYKNATWENLFNESERKGMLSFPVSYQSHLILWNNKGQWTTQTLPEMIQYSSVHAILPYDVNQDGKTDLILAGNHFWSKPEVGTQAGGYGWVLLNKGSQKWEVLSPSESGLILPGACKHLEVIKGRNNKHLIAARNNLTQIKFLMHGKSIPIQ